MADSDPQFEEKIVFMNVLMLADPESREAALLELSKKREAFPNLARKKID
jgi:hypothetical protein